LDGPSEPSLLSSRAWSIEAVGQAASDSQIRNLIAFAKQAAAGGRAHEAERLRREAEVLAPRHPLVLNETAVRLLLAGDASGAYKILERLVKSERSNPEFWFNFGSALRRLSRFDEALSAFDKVLSLEPRNIAGLLEKGSLEEAQNRPRAAAITYRTALQMIPPGYVTPQWMEGPLRHARAVVEQNNRALETFVEEALGELRVRFCNQPLDRFDRCMDILLQKRLAFRQQPTFMYFPELPVIEFYDRREFPWLDEVDARTDQIRQEIVKVLSEDGSAALDPYVADQPGLPLGVWRELNQSRRWGVYPLWREGVAFPEHIARCPRTIAALENCPRWDVPGSGPTALFSILDAKTRIPPHTGPVNTRLVVHLPLIVPPGCHFRVGGQEREWKEGKAFIFDDSINHEARNDSENPRAVFIFDIWSPYITAAERELVRAATARIAEYYGSLPNSGSA
jgi:aspartate beta-hydroxylase